jgi:hypothetical protein
VTTAKCLHNATLKVLLFVAFPKRFIEKDNDVIDRYNINIDGCFRQGTIMTYDAHTPNDPISDKTDPSTRCPSTLFAPPNAIIRNNRKKNPIK